MAIFKTLEKLQFWGPFGNVEFSTPLENFIHVGGGV
jgi:predicted ferric reductase